MEGWEIQTYSHTNMQTFLLFLFIDLPDWQLARPQRPPETGLEGNWWSLLKIFLPDFGGRVHIKENENAERISN